MSSELSAATSADQSNSAYPRRQLISKERTDQLEQCNRPFEMTLWYWHHLPLWFRLMAHPDKLEDEQDAQNDVNDGDVMQEMSPLRLRVDANKGEQER